MGLRLGRRSNGAQLRDGQVSPASGEREDENARHGPVPCPLSTSGYAARAAVRKSERLGSGEALDAPGPTPAVSRK